MTVSGIIALVLGILSLLICYIPILNNGSVILGAIGAVLGIVAVIATRAKGKRSGRIIAILGLALSAISIIVALTVQAALSKAIDDAFTGPTASETASGKASEAGNKETGKESETAFDEAYLTHGHIKIAGLTKAGNDYDGKPTVIATYEWTNTGDDTMFMTAFNTKAFQNGASLNLAIYLDHPEGYDANASMTTLKKGTTQTVTVAYVLTDETSPVTIEASDFIGGDTKIAKEFTL
ncbi:DUF5067 domain-containing protein [Bifidobacterium aquikefiricola]|uniref:DUF5067 domain-containing protein n=1 Tax=Bifidobacterium aquikefiricola TaxID=3059038 RepID=A0AB39U597_9BIFI